MRIDNVFKPKFESQNVVAPKRRVIIPGVTSPECVNLNKLPASNVYALTTITYEAVGFYFHKDWADRANIIIEERSCVGDVVVHLQREFNNKYDDNATIIVPSPELYEATGVTLGGIGYVPKEYAKTIAEAVAEGKQLFSTISKATRAGLYGNLYPTIAIKTNIYEASK